MTHRPVSFSAPSLPALAAALGAVFGLSSAALAETCECQSAWASYASFRDDRAFHDASGRDLRNYAPDRRVDLQHMKLDLTIPDMNTPRLDAVETLAFSPIATPLDVLTLNAEGFELGEITGGDGADVESVSYDGSTLQIRFASPIPAGREASVRIEYALNDPVDGLFWTPESDAWNDRPAQIHTQGQPETNRFWFATHDYPNERLTTEIIATVPEGFLVSANGSLVGEYANPGVRTFHWLQDEPHVSYLVSLVVGKFDVVDVGTPDLAMPVYVPEGRAGDVEGTYGRTDDMVRVFEERFDEPYPWDRYAQLVVHNFGAGGMENTSATTMYDTAIYTEKGLIDDDLDGLISHELGHQWFGDLITCNRWADIWLNEGFATYSTALWYEARDGYGNGYLRQVLSNFDRFSGNDRLDPDDERAGLRVAMVSRVYTHPWEVFRRKANPYPKGASVLHMLRMKLGDDVFFGGIAAYVDRHKNSTVETADFRRAMEDASGLSLDRFFQQWVHRPGVPELDIRASYDLENQALTIALEQTQRIDEFAPAFVFDLPVLITRAGGGVQELVIRMDSRAREQTVPLREEPKMVVIDPELCVMARKELDLPEAWLIEQLENGPTTPSRIVAARALEGASASASDPLRRALFDPENHYSVRSAAAHALAKNDALDPVLTIAADFDEDARTRAACVDALRATEDESVVNTMRKLAINPQQPFSVRAAAVRAVGALGKVSDLAIIESALRSDSRDDEVRQAALRALADLDTEDALDRALPYVYEGSYSRTRPVAIEAVAALAHHDPARAYDAIAPLAEDRREARTRTAAIDAIVAIEDNRGVAHLRNLAETHHHPVQREHAARAADQLAAALASDDADTKLRGRVEELERRLDELSEK